MTRADLTDYGQTLVAGLDQINPWMLLVVVPLMVVVVGAVVVAVVAALCAAFVVANCAGVVIVARRAVHWAATYQRTTDVEAVTS